MAVPEVTYDTQPSHGIAWVCDVRQSSSLLNSDMHIDSLLLFLTRLHTVSRYLVATTEGQYIKWTGDGFLAWATPYTAVFKYSFTRHTFLSAWLLSSVVEVTQLAVKSDRRFSIGHSIIFDRHAYSFGNSLVSKNPRDYIGRGITLAFRVTGLAGSFPFITASSDLISAYLQGEYPELVFTKRIVSDAERERVTKGEQWGIGELYQVTTRQRQPVTLRDTFTMLEQLCHEPEVPVERNSLLGRMARFVRFLRSLEWGKEFNDAVRTGLIPGPLVDRVNGLDNDEKWMEERERQMKAKDNPGATSPA